MSECNFTQKTKISISVLAGLLNFLLSSIIPVIINSSNSNPNNSDIFTNITKVFSNNKELIITSSFIVTILVYLSLEITPRISTFKFSNISKLY